jgi:hypothetical protein
MVTLKQNFPQQLNANDPFGENLQNATPAQREYHIRGKINNE